MQVVPQVSELQSRLGASEAALAETQQAHAECSQQANEELSRLHAQLVRLRDEAERLSRENQQLLGRYVAKARQLQDQPINLPDSLEELRFQCLQLQEDLIKVQLDKETLEENLRGSDPVPARPGQRRHELQAGDRAYPHPRGQRAAPAARPADGHS
ncbi:hypothetical protein MRX96_050046 [Rhipicephalus microplus]